jgi:hypothetical protein
LLINHFVFKSMIVMSFGVVLIVLFGTYFLKTSGFVPNSENDELVFPIVTEDKLFKTIGPMSQAPISPPLIVPSIVHQVYDYQSPNFFLYLSLVSVQRFIRPLQHILWVNDEGRYRRGHWQSWQHKFSSATTPEQLQSWEYNFTQLITAGKIEVKFHTFPGSPPGNASIYAPNKAHRSDFVRLSALTTIGGIYLDTDAFAVRSMDELRTHNFTMSFDNIVNENLAAPKRLNNGVMLAAPQSQFLHLWAKKYANFNPESFDYDSSVVPYNLMTQFPDLIHLEMSRIAPVSFAFQTARAAEMLTCGFWMPPRVKTSSLPARKGAIWAPEWNPSKKVHTFEGTRPSTQFYDNMEKRLVLHLTMSQVR